MIVSTTVELLINITHPDKFCRVPNKLEIPF